MRFDSLINLTHSNPLRLKAACQKCHTLFFKFDRKVALTWLRRRNRWNRRTAPWFAPGRLQIRFVPWALSLSLAGLSHDSLALKRAAVSTLVLQAALRILSLEVETAAATTPGWLSIVSETLSWEHVIL
jgi:hypothetical protein